MLDLKSHFQNRRNLWGFIALVILILAIPIGIYLARNTQIFRPSADITGTISLTEGDCVTELNGERVLICKDAPIRLSVPIFDASPSASIIASLSPTPVTSLVPSPSVSVSASPSPAFSPTPSPTPIVLASPSPTPPASCTSDDLNDRVLVDFLLDTSGSMSEDGGGKFTKLKQAVREVKPLFNQTDYVGMLSLTTVILPTNLFSQNSSQYDSKINSLETRGSTPLGSAMARARDELNRVNNVSVDKKVLLVITDGCPDEGQNPEAFATQIKNSGVQIGVLGIELGSDEKCDFWGGASGARSLMTRVASPGMFFETNESGIPQGVKNLFQRTTCQAVAPEKTKSSILASFIKPFGNFVSQVSAQSVGSKFLGESCSSGSQCRSGVCTSGVCRLGAGRVGASCSNSDMCSTRFCVSGKCKEGPNPVGASCTSDNNCRSAECGSGNKCVYGETRNGDPCSHSDLCQSRFCNNFKCEAQASSPTPRPTSTPRQSSTPTPTPARSPALSPSPTPVPSPSPTPENVIDVANTDYRLAETEAGLNSALYRPYTKSPSREIFAFADDNPGVKQIWVEFKNTITNQTKKAHINVKMVNFPKVETADCTLSVNKQELKVTLAGKGFGNTKGKLNAGQTDLEVLKWNENQIEALLKDTAVSSDGKTFQFNLKRSDNAQFQDPIICKVDTSLVALGARVFCRELGKFDFADVKVVITDQNNNRTEETVTINKDGTISNLKTPLQAGRPAAVSIRVPNSLRTNALFTTSKGTTFVSTKDGSPFILPIGDIAPIILQDGKINTLDRSELLRQWSVIGTTSSSRSADFNRDTKVNSIDWACMRYDFNREDEALPIIEIPIESSPPQASVSATPSATQAVSPSPVSSPTPLPTGRAAYFLPAPSGSGSYPLNSDFVVYINVWSQNEGANLFNAQMSFDPTALEVVRVERGTAISNWVDSSFDNAQGKISLIAGVPSPGLKTTQGQDPQFASIIFRGKKVGLSTVSMDQGSGIYANSDNSNIISALISAPVNITSGL